MGRGGAAPRNSFRINDLQKHPLYGAIALFEYLNKSLVFFADCVKLPHENERNHLDLRSKF